MSSQADLGKKRNAESNEENKPEPPSQTTRLIDQPGIALRNYDCCAHQAKHGTRCADGCTNLWMPAVNEKNYETREKHAEKINRHSQWSSHSLFEDAAVPEKQPCVKKDVN